MSEQNINRRDFLKTAAATAALAMAPRLAPAAAETSSNPARLPRRPYKPGIKVSIIGFPGLVMSRLAPEDCNRTVARAYEMGCNYFDVAPAYGNSQERLGPALKPYRKDVFLACKTKARDAAGCKKELARSLELLKTDHFDLYQLHALKFTDKDVDVAFQKGGCIEAMLEARKAGVIRHIGFTTHTTESALAAMERFDFDSILFPLNYASMMRGEFGPAMLEMAKKKNCARISMKAMVKQEWPRNAKRGKWSHLWYEPLDDPKDADMAVRYALSQDITTAIPPGDATLMWAMMEIGMKYRPVTPDEEKHLQELAATVTPFFRKGVITG